MQITFYVDILFLLSFVSNWITYWLTGLLVRKRNRYIRMTIGAGASSLLFLLSLFYPIISNGYNGVLFWIGVTVGITFFVFGKDHVVRNWFCSTTTMFLIGSVMTSLKTIINIPIITLGKWILLLISSVGLLVVFGKWIILKKQKGALICSIMICENGHPIIIKGLEDSGNLLIDPYTGRSVVLIQNEIVKLCVDTTVKQLVESYEMTGKIDYDFLLRCDRKWGIHELSYQSVGAATGRLLCIYIDELYVNQRRFKKQPIAVVQDHLFEDKKYQAIVSGWMF